MYNKVIEILNKAVVKSIKVYDVTSLTPFFDYSIVCSVNTSRQGNAAVNYLKKEAEMNGLTVKSFTTTSDTTWFLVDLTDIVVHLFVGEERIKYNLDEMYGNNPVEYIE